MKPMLGFLVLMREIRENKAPARCPDRVHYQVCKSSVPPGNTPRVVVIRCARSAERPMPTRFNKIHPALKHAGYSATTILPGEDLAAFEKLHRDLIARFSPVGALQEDAVAEMAHLTWRKRNLGTFRIAELARARYQKIYNQHFPVEYFAPLDGGMDSAEREERRRAAEQEARQELGDVYPLVDIGEPATIEQLMTELDIKERLDGLIEKCLKRLLMIRGVESLSSSSKSTPQILDPRKAG
jgi:hypothetical protein